MNLNPMRFLKVSITFLCNYFNGFLFSFKKFLPHTHILFTTYNIKKFYRKRKKP